MIVDITADFWHVVELMASTDLSVYDAISATQDTNSYARISTLLSAGQHRVRLAWGQDGVEGADLDETLLLAYMALLEGNGFPTAAQQVRRAMRRVLEFIDMQCCLGEAGLLERLADLNVS